METQTVVSSTKDVEVEKSDLKYKIVQETELIVQNKKAIDTLTEIEWQIEPLPAMEFETVLVKVLKTEVKKIGSAYNGLMSYMQQLNKVNEEIALQLGQYGNVVKVINDQEIWAKWQMLRQALIANAPNPNDLQAMLKGGDIDYRDPTTMVKNTPLYKIIFFPVIGEKEHSSSFKPLNVFGSLPSQLYLGQKVDYGLSEKVTAINEREIKLTQVGKIAPGKANTFKTEFEKNYQALLGKSYDYKWDYTVEYVLGRTDNTILSCIAEIIEETSPQLIHKNKFTISLLN